MATKGKRHFSAMADVSVCGLRVGLARAYAMQMSTWNALPMRERCPECEKMMADRRAANLREVAEIEARDAAKRAAKAA